MVALSSDETTFGMIRSKGNVVQAILAQRLATRAISVSLVEPQIVDEAIAKQIADMTPTDEDFEIASSPPPESWYKEQW
jgi:hypothetical protein